MSTLHELIKYGWFFGGKSSGGSGGGTQPDWNQNDPTKADYVKNRPFYSEETEVVLLEETNASFTEGAFFVDKMTFPDSVLNVRVSWNGVEYNCPALYTTGEFDVIVGNTAVFGGPDTGDPFAIGFGKVGAVIIGVDGSETVTTSIVCIKESATEIPKKFFPEDICFGANDYTSLTIKLDEWGRDRVGKSTWLDKGTFEGVANGMTREAFDELVGFVKESYSFTYDENPARCDYAENGSVAVLGISGEFISIVVKAWTNIGSNNLTLLANNYVVLWDATENAAYTYRVYYQYDLSASVNTNAT